MADGGLPSGMPETRASDAVGPYEINSSILPIRRLLHLKGSFHVVMTYCLRPRDMGGLLSTNSPALQFSTFDCWGVAGPSGANKQRRGIALPGSPHIRYHHHSRPSCSATRQHVTPKPSGHRSCCGGHEELDSIGLGGEYERVFHLSESHPL